MFIVFTQRWFLSIATGIVLNTIAIPAKAQIRLYNPVSIASDKEVADTLTEKDIPTGEG